MGRGPVTSWWRAGGAAGRRGPKRRPKPCAAQALVPSCRARAAALADAAAPRIVAHSSPAKGLDVHPAKLAPHRDGAHEMVQRMDLRLLCGVTGGSLQRAEEAVRAGGGGCGWQPLIHESRSFMEDAGFDAEAFWGGVVTRPATQSRSRRGSLGESVL